MAFGHFRHIKLDTPPGTPPGTDDESSDDEAKDSIATTRRPSDSTLSRSTSVTSAASDAKKDEKIKNLQNTIATQEQALKQLQQEAGEAKTAFAALLQEQSARHAVLATQEQALKQLNQAFEAFKQEAKTCFTTFLQEQLAWRARNTAGKKHTQETLADTMRRAMTAEQTLYAAYQKIQVLTQAVQKNERDLLEIQKKCNDANQIMNDTFRRVDELKKENDELKESKKKLTQHLTTCLFSPSPRSPHRHHSLRAKTEAESRECEEVKESHFKSQQERMRKRSRSPKWHTA